MSARNIECDRATEIRPHLAGVDAEILDVLREAKILARRFYLLTGKPLGITGEVAEYEAATKLGLTLHCARHAGHDATILRNGHEVQIQIKGRCVSNQTKLNGRLGSIDLDKSFDVVLLVLLDSEFDAFAMYEASREAVVLALMKPGSKARNERGALGVKKFIAISECCWKRS
ncbi:hypothetical protein PHLH6_38680 [Pseudomonas sp. Seg1]|uniref:DUF6998 domain-containing protein n=1 Tax=Pseudomonas sp. Seg1 TaxID=2678259 RepID=UPI001BF0C6A5|nr:hypothetical protein [Pseudomonas sp. Seg1]BBP71864.1 hypothetical protein PHLH6_38680 [Pseudomonas sp. Seg1]